MFRSIENETYEIAVSLAKTYHVPLWDIYMIHLEFLFDENENQYVLLLLIMLKLFYSHLFYSVATHFLLCL